MFDIRTHEPNDQLLKFLKMFDDWKPAAHRVERPESMRSRRDRVLSQLVRVPTLSVEEAKRSGLLDGIDDLSGVLATLRGEKNPWLGESGHLVRDLAEAGAQFPFRDPSRLALR